MSELAIAGLGVVGAFGCGSGALAASLSGAPPLPTRVVIPADGGELELPALLADAAPLERFVSRRATRRIDHFSRLALLGAHLALEDGAALETSRDRLGVIIATGYGPLRTTFAFLDSVRLDGDSCASPTHFSNSVHNAAAAHVAIELGAIGPNLTVSQFELSVASALLTARTWLLEGRVERVLFGAVDEFCSVLGYCWERFFPGARSGVAEPLDFDRQSAVAGEGAAFFLLEGPAGRDRYGRIGEVGFGRRGVAGSVAPAAATYLLGADGHAGCGAHYPPLLPAGAAVAAFAPHYGSFPAAAGFDLAVAALARRDGHLPQQGTALAGPLCCLKCDREGRFGAVLVNSMGGGR